MTNDDEPHGSEPEDVPETIDLGDDSSASSNSWDRLIEQLRSRGPIYQRYVFEGEIAHGGMGAIHRVYDQDARRRLALKVMLGKGEVPAKGDTPEVGAASLGRFLEEAQVTSQLDHPGIVPVHEIGVDGGGQVYFTMKLVKGEDLRSVFDRVADPRDADWSATRALNVMLRVCEAMAYAHAKGVIHRDLKPGNVMVGRFGEAYVMDWGLAKVMGREDHYDLRLRPESTQSLRTERSDAARETPDSPILTMDGAVVGTPAYMPPEQALGRVEELGAQADVYAVGAMLYDLLARRMPYSEPGARMSARMILYAATQGPPPALTELAPRTPSELVAIVEKAMAREIGDRYPDMTALARDLRAYLEHRVVGAYETGAWAELKKWVQRNKALAMTAVAGVVVVAALGIWSNFTIRAERNTAKANEDDATRQRDRADENAAEAKLRAAEADEARRQAEAERDRVLRLSDKRRLDELLAVADTLWPAHPARLDELKRWLDRANELLENLPLHEAALARIREKGRRAPSKDAAILEVAYEFGDRADAWWHDAAQDLVIGLQTLESGDANGPTIAGIEDRIEWAETVIERTITSPDIAARWAEARAAIHEHPGYGGLSLEPQIGLVPLGPDPGSKLWEFAHARSGEVPTRNPVTKLLGFTAESSIVLTLMPGGEYRIGAQAVDETSPHHDPYATKIESPVHEVRLDPFFISKFEMTEGQWWRASGESPSWHSAMRLTQERLISGLDFNFQFNNPFSRVMTRLKYPRIGHPYPIENVSWLACERVLGRLGLLLPTESQWEAACRARSTTSWSFGGDASLVSGFANTRGESSETDPSMGTAPVAVGSFQPNAFGLQDLHGNVSEWCLDPLSQYSVDLPPGPGDGLRLRIPGSDLRSHRGGSVGGHLSQSRSASREFEAPDFRSRWIGCRPARSLD